MGASRTEPYRRQHAELLELAAGLEALLSEDVLRRDAAGARLQLSKLAGSLSRHLAMEDDALYPALAMDADEWVRDVATAYVKDMGGLRQAFAEYCDRWAPDRLIAESPAQFIEETKAILAALKERIHREDTELYVLVDRPGR